VEEMHSDGARIVDPYVVHVSIIFSFFPFSFFFLIFF